MEQRKMYLPLFNYLNYTLPCHPECSLEFGIPKKCAINQEKTEILILFRVPVIDTQLALVEADPFLIRKKINNQTC